MPRYEYTFGKHTTPPSVTSVEARVRNFLNVLHIPLTSAEIADWLNQSQPTLPRMSKHAVRGAIRLWRARRADPDAVVVAADFVGKRGYLEGCMAQGLLRRGVVRTIYSHKGNTSGKK